MSEWAASDHGCSAAGTSSFRQQRCVVLPPLTPQNSSPCFGSQGNATVHGPLSYILSQIFFQTVLSHLFINICFVAVVMHSHQAALHRLQTTRLHCLGNPGSLCKRQQKTENRGNIGPTLVVAFIALDFFFCVDEHWDESLEASFRRERETGLISLCKIFWLRIAGKFYKRICVDFQPRKKYSIDQPAIKSLAENSDKHNHQSL